MSITLLPESAPFDADQRAWLNGFFAGLLGMQVGNSAQSTAVQNVALAVLPSANGHGTAVAEPEEDFPWHDPALDMEERLRLAAEKPLPRQLMAAMAQLDCGACGYHCQSYSEAIAQGSESNLKLCAPGGQDTAKMLKKLLQMAPANGSNGANGPKTSANGAATHPTPANGKSTSKYSRNNPFPAKLKSTLNLNKAGSDKCTTHVVIDLTGSGLTYEVGDSLGVVPKNCPDFVKQVIEALGTYPELEVTSANNSKQLLFELLLNADLRDVDERLVTLLEDFATAEQLATLRNLAEDEDRLAGMDVLDLLMACPAQNIDIERFVSVLRPLTPRLYSIASSQRANPDEVHLTVARATKLVSDRLRLGVASTMFADRVAPGTSIPVFVQPSHGFRLPADPATPIIMVGPGTGIAPFRAFIQDRKAAGAKGDAWLFFGDQRQATDFLYDDEWNVCLKEGSLTRLDVAFSRDQTEKIYVQNRMREQGAELFRWLESGAYFYVCGDAKRMAVDVDRALHDVVEKFGGKSPDQAKAYIADLQKHKRYLRDVY